MTSQLDPLLSDADINAYWENGYWVGPVLFTADEVAHLRAEHERWWRREHDRNIPSQYGLTEIDLNSPRLRQDCNGFWLNDAFRQAVTKPALGAIAAQLMKVDCVRLWHDQVIYKPGQRDTAGEAAASGNVGWHQDYGFWQAASTTNMVTAWIALQDTDLHNGGMRFVPGSHRWGLVEDSDAFHIKDLDALAAQFGQAGEWREEPCILQAGQVSFHHSLTFHGSGPNHSDQPRLSLVAHMMPCDTRYQAGQQWHPNVLFLGPEAQDGQPFSGPYWPQLWPAPG